jgi:hypothetical protein
VDPKYKETRSASLAVVPSSLEQEELKNLFMQQRNKLQNFNSLRGAADFAALQPPPKVE